MNQALDILFKLVVLVVLIAAVLFAFDLLLSAVD